MLRPLIPSPISKHIRFLLGRVGFAGARATDCPGKMIRSLTRPVSLMPLAGILVASGCAVGPDFRAPEPPVDEGYTRESVAPAPSANTTAQVIQIGADVSANWWTVFGSDKLDKLVEQALMSNPSIDSANAALRIAQENTNAQRGNYFPTVEAQYSPSRQRNPVGTLAPTLSSGAPVYTLHTAQLTISYVPDVFGLNRRQVESLEAQESSQRAQLAAARVSLETNVLAAAFQRATLEAQVEATHAMIDAQRDSLKIIERQRTVGYAAGLDVAAQEAALAQMEATLPPLERQLEQARDLLGALAANNPAATLPTIGLDDINLPRELPLSVPARLVVQRPDVRSALDQLHAATAEVGVADADLLPQLSITGAYGGVATHAADMFRADNIFWSLVGSATQTLFDGGTLLARQRAAQAGVDQALALYKITVVQAMQNVADSLYALETDDRAMRANLRAENAARSSLDLTRRQFEAGYSTALNLLAAQSTYQQAVLNRVQARGTWLADTAALFQALGGGWWNDPGLLASNSSPSSHTDH